jgi:hypothetical protein
MLTGAFLVLIVLIATEAMARSRAGLVLTMAAVAGIFATAFAERRKTSGIGPGKLLLGATALAVMLAVQFTLYRILDRFAVEPLADARVTFARDTVSAASAFTPFGAGVGTFVPVYAMFEQPSDTLGNVYINHAHNDFLEVWLETGVLGLPLFGVFVFLLGFRSVELWWRPPDKAGELDRLLMRAATVAIALLVAHSFVEYPLRTGAIMAIFAFSCALLFEPLGVAEEATIAATEARRVSMPRQRAESLRKTATPVSFSQVSSAIPAQRSEVSQPLSRQPAGRWGEEIAWPAEWQKANVQKPPDAPSQSGAAVSPDAAVPSQSGGTAPTQTGATAPSQSGGNAPSQSSVTGPSQSGGAGSNPSAAALARSAAALSQSSGAAAPSQSDGTRSSASGAGPASANTAKINR